MSRLKRKIDKHRTDIRFFLFIVVEIVAGLSAIMLFLNSTPLEKGLGFLLVGVAWVTGILTNREYDKNFEDNKRGY